MVRTTRPRRLILLRHAETIKNKQGKHGGGDETLTERGFVQLEMITKRLLQQIDPSSQLTLSCQPDIRCVNSATVLGPKLGVRPQVIEQLRGIDMGVVSGLSDRQLALRHPLVALSYLQWRAGSSLRRPYIKGAESIKDFAKRSQLGLEKLLTVDDADTTIFVGTTSGLLMINHLLVQDGHLDRRNYHFYELGFGELAIWQLGPHEPPQLISSK